MIFTVISLMKLPKSIIVKKYGHEIIQKPLVEQPKASRRLQPFLQLKTIR